MRLIRAEIDGFGKLVGQTIEFSEGLQLIFGKNESGKSTLVHFIEQMLFGFETAKKENRHFRPQNKRAVFGGRLFLELPGYGEVVIERIGIKGKEKVRNNTETKITLENGQELSEEEFFQKIRPLNLRLFHSVYGLKQEQLSEVRALSAEELEETLLSIASTGSRELIKKARELQETTSRLFAKKGSARPVNSAISELLNTRKRIVQKEKEENAYQEIQQRLRKVEEEIQENRATFQDKEAIVQRLDQQLRAKESVQEWQRLREELKKSPPLSEVEWSRLTEFYQKYLRVQEELMQANKRYQVALTTELANQTENYSFYLQEKEQVAVLLEKEQLVMELTQREQEHQAALEAAVDVILQLSARWKWQEDLPPQQLDYEKVRRLQEDFLRLKFECETLMETEKNRSFSSEAVLLVFPVLSVGMGAWLFTSLPAVWNVAGFLSLSTAGIGLAVFAKWGRTKYRLRVQKRQLDENQQKMRKIWRHFLELVERAQLKEMKKMEEVLHFGHQVEEFRQALTTRAQKEAVLEEIREQLLGIEEETEFLREWIPLSELHVKDQFQRIRKFVSEMEEISEENRVQNSSMIFQRIQELEAEIQSMKEEAEKWIQQYHLADFKGLEAFLKQQEKINAAQVRLDWIAAQLKELFDLASETIHFEEISQELKEGEREIQRLQEAYQQLLKESGKLKGKKSLLEEDGTLLEWVQNEGFQRENFQNLVREWLVNQVETELLIDLLRHSSDQTLHELLAAASQLFSSLTSGKYVGIELVGSGVQVEDWRGELFRLADLSTGSSDQLYFSVRMAFLLHQNKHFAPILMDDVWLHYDEDRKGNFFTVLQEIAQEEQMLLFSSDERMRSHFLGEAPEKLIDLDELQAEEAPVKA